MLRPTIFTLLASLSIATITEAQRPVYRPPAAQEKRWTVRFSSSALFGVNLNLKNLGSVGFTGSEINADGSTTFFYNDGLVTLPDGQTTTSSFVFSWDEQGDNLNAGVDPFGRKTGQSLDEFTLSRYSAVALSGNLEPEESLNTGWEIAYKYEWGTSKNRIRFGLVAGLGIYNLDFDSFTTVNSELRIDRDTFGVSQPIDYDSSQAFFNGSSLGSVRIDASGLPEAFAASVGQTFTYIDPTTGESVVAQVPVEVDFEYDGVIAMTRIGPSISVRLIDELYFEISAGLVAAYLDAQVSQTNTIQDGLPDDFDIFGRFTQTDIEDHNDTLFGYYIEGLLRYQLTPRVGFHASLMQMGFSEQDEVEIGNSTYELDLTAPSIGSAGVTIIF